jgi:predicted nuclease of predicted toxin-antitoxin system
MNFWKAFLPSPGNRPSEYWNLPERASFARSSTLKILLDHNLDWRLSRHLPGHEVKSAVELNWDTLVNGALLGEAERNGFTVMITADKGIKNQQRLKGRGIAVLILRAPNSKLATHISMMEEANLALLSIQPGEVIEIHYQKLAP